MTWDATTQAAATGPVIHPFFALSMTLPAAGVYPSRTVNLLDGSGTVTFNSATYKGLDVDFGSWSAADSFSDGVALSSSRFIVTLQLLTTASVAQVGAPQAQGAPVTVYLGFLNPATGVPYANPITYRVGFIDTAKISISTNQKAVDIDVIGATEYLMLNNDGARLNSSFHNLFYPTDTAFDFVTNVTQQVPWGQSGPRPDQVTGISNYNYGFQGSNTTLNFGGGNFSAGIL